RHASTRANSGPAVTAGIPGQAKSWAKVVLIGLRVAEGYDTRDIGNRIQGLGFVADRIGPIFVAQAEIDGQARAQLEIILREERKQTLGSEKTSGSCIAQRPAHVVGCLIVNEQLQRAVPVVAIAARQKELRINEMRVFAAEFEGVLSFGPRNIVANLIGILLLGTIVPRPDGRTSEVAEGHIVRTCLARIREEFTEIGILQAEVVDHTAAERPNVGQGNFAIADKL